MEVEEIEVVELASDRFIQLEKYRQWPKLGVLWSVRQRVGESDYPMHRGSEEGVPAASQDPAELWTSLRGSALAAAQSAAKADVQEAPEKKRSSLFARLFKRR